MFSRLLPLVAPCEVEELIELVVVAAVVEGTDEGRAPLYPLTSVELVE